MSSEFNAYSTWLGIPEDEQPPHYYRLLGLEPFESDPDVIRQAGQRVISMIKSREKGSLGSAARRLKAELTFAAACLLDEKKKAQYDKELDAWFNEFDGGSGDDYELEEPDLPMAKIVSREKSKSKSGSSKSKSGSSIRTSGSKSGSGKSKAKATKAEPKQAKNSLNVGLIVGLAVAVVAILGLGGALAYFVLKPDKPAVAQADKKPAEPAFDPDEEEEDTSTKKPASGEEEEEPAAGEKKTDDAADPDEEGEKKTETPAEGEKDPAAGATDTLPTFPPKTDPAPTDPAKTDPAKAEAVASADPAAKPADTPMQAAESPIPMKEEAKPEPEKAPPAQPETPADPKLQDPFRDLGAALEIPVFVDAQTSTTPTVIAKVYPKEEERVNAKLQGGDAVLGKVGEFTISGGGLTDPEPKWTIKFVDKKGTATPIANLSYKANEFTFAWTGEGTPETNNVLQNCLLQITVGYANKRLPMRVPQEIEPLSVVMEPKGTELVIPLSGLPDDLDAVTLEITKLVGGFPADATYDPGQQLKPGDKFSVMFSKIDLAFKGEILEERGGGLKLDFRPMWRGEKRGNGPRPLKPYANSKPSIDDRIAAVQMNLANGTKFYNEVWVKQNAGKKEILEQGALKFQADTEAANRLIKELTDLKTTIETLSKDGKVQFRIFMRVGDVAEGYSVELVKTKDYSPPEEEKKEEPKKAPAKKKK